MAKPFKTPSNELADIAVNHFAIHHPREQVSHSSKPVDTICQDKGWTAHTSHSSHGHTPSAPSKDHPNCTWQSKLPSMWYPLFQLQQNGTLGTQMPWWQATPNKECTSTWVRAEEVQMPTKEPQSLPRVEEQDRHHRYQRGTQPLRRNSPTLHPTQHYNWKHSSWRDHGQRCPCLTVQWGIHHHPAACKHQQKGNSLTPH